MKETFEKLLRGESPRVPMAKELGPYRDVLDQPDTLYALLVSAHRTLYVPDGDVKNTVYAWDSRRLSPDVLTVCAWVMPRVGGPKEYRTILRSGNRLKNDANDFKFGLFGVYSDQGDVLRANESFVMIHAVTSGEKTIRLPGPRTVRNLATDEVTKNVSTMTLPMKEGDTIILQLVRP